MLQVFTANRTDKYMSSKILEPWNKVTFENTLGNKDLFKVNNKNDSRTVSVNTITESLYLARVMFP